MSQDLREYGLESIDRKRHGSTEEATWLAVTATVGPTVDEQSRGVQLTLGSPEGVQYGRLSQQQVLDLITVLSNRLAPAAEDFEATGYGSGEKRIEPDGTEVELEP